MICVSIQNRTYEEILDLLDDAYYEMAELRLDRLDLSDQQITDIFEGTEKPLVATCRLAEREDALHRLTLAAKAGAAYVDMELDAPAHESKYIQRLCANTGTLLIRSYHNFECTPDSEFLSQVLARCFRYGADIAKIATTSTSEGDAEKLAALYSQARRGSVMAFAMNDTRSRKESLCCGAPFCYAAMDRENASAPGQIPVGELFPEIYGGTKGFYRTDLTMPCSKSYAQRAIIAAALSEGCSRLSGYTPCDDNEAAIKVARLLGAKLSRKGSTLSITGIGPVKAPLEIRSVDAGQSGLLARLMIPIMAAIGPGEVEMCGSGTLLDRPLPLSAEIMASFGVLLSGEKLPLKVSGRLIPGFAEVSGRGGSQLISGLLMAIPLCPERAALVVEEPKSIPYMFITVDLLKKFGIRYSSEMEGDERLSEQDWNGCEAVSFRTMGGSYKAADLELESDWSAAAVFLAAGAIFGHAEVSGLDTQSLQADVSILDLLVEAGACVSEDRDQKIVSARKGPLRAFSFDLSNAPDLFPVASVLAAFCEGETVLYGTDRLHAKESDRAEAILETLKGLGVVAHIEDDALHVQGRSLAARLAGSALLHGGKFRTFGDHRIAMALKLAEFGADGAVVPDDPSCVSKSYPDFYSNFD